MNRYEKISTRKYVTKRTHTYNKNVNNRGNGIGHTVTLQSL